MKMKNLVKTLVALGVVTAGTIYLVNHYIQKNAEAEDVEKPERESFPFTYGEVHYEVMGEGEPLLLLHETDCASSVAEWRSVMPLLAENNKVYALDLPGCGFSQRKKLHYTNFFYVELLQEFIQKVIGERTDVIATGYSGSICLLADAYNSELLNHITMVSPRPLEDFGEEPDTKDRLMADLLLVPIVGTAIYNYIHRKSAIKQVFQELYFDWSSDVPEETWKEYYLSAHRNKNTGKYLLRSFWRGYLNVNLIPVLSKERENVALIYGDAGEAIAEEYLKYHPDLRCVHFGDTGMLPQLEFPEVFASEYEDLWEEVEGEDDFVDEGTDETTSA